jgi:phosphoribosylformylglycinamidine synthase
VKAAVVVFPGSNCDRDCEHVLARVVGASVRMIWHRETDLPPADVVVIPGGFSYGDYLRTGALAACSPIMESVRRHAARGGLILGICNGFQILVESGLLPGALLRNASLKFICRTVGVRVERTDTPFTTRYAAGQLLRLPIAHADGAYWADPPTLARLRDKGQIVFRYAPLEDGVANPNGSIDAIAGVCNDTRNVLGMMPHPERASESELGSDDGRALFESALSAMCGPA